jgi:hydroxypyruvate isomerase
MRRVKESGIGAVEFWGWGGKDLDAIASAKEELGMEIVGFCPNFFVLNDPAERGRYVDELGKAVEVAAMLKAKRIITQVGDTLAGTPLGRQRESVVEGLRECVPILRAADVTLLIEPLSVARHAGTFLSSSKEGLSIVKEAASPHVRLLFDFYHMQLMEGSLLESSLANLELIGHFHCAGAPGRRELDNGEINYPFLFRRLDEAGHDGYFGLEYFPLEEPEKGLRALAKLEEKGSLEGSV